MYCLKNINEQLSYFDPTNPYGFKQTQRNAKAKDTALCIRNICAWLRRSSLAQWPFESVVDKDPLLRGTDGKANHLKTVCMYVHNEVQ